MKVREGMGLMLLLVAGALHGGHGWAQAKQISYQRFGSPDAERTVVVLHGAAGPEAYAGQAKELAAAGFYVLFPHYYEASKTRTPNDENYATWVKAVDGVVKSRLLEDPKTKLSLFGISLGASVALALGTQSGEIESVVEWSGSLPDKYFAEMNRLPPLLILHGVQDQTIPVINARQLIRLCEMRQVACESKIYEDQSHIFDAAGHMDAMARTVGFLREAHGGLKTSEVPGT